MLQLQKQILCTTAKRKTSAVNKGLYVLAKILNMQMWSRPDTVWAVSFILCTLLNYASPSCLALEHGDVIQH